MIQLLHNQSFFWKGQQLEFSYLRELIAQNSLTSDFNAINDIQDKIERDFKILGCSVNRFYNHEKIPLLDIHYGDEKKEPITLICHSDCVNEADDYFFENDQEIRGVGVIDNKAAIFMAYSLIKRLKNLKKDIHIRVLIYPSEERGSIGFEKISKKMGEEGFYFLGLEPAEEGGALITCRGGNRWYEFSFKSQKFHSGRIKMNDLSLGNEIFKRLNDALYRLNNFENLKLNVTSLKSSNNSFNTTVGDIKLGLDLRFLDIESRNLANNYLMTESFKGLKFDYTIHDDCPPMEESLGVEDLVKLFFKNAEQKHVTSYGAADLNYISNDENICVDGFGAIGHSMHSKREVLLKEETLKRMDMLYEIVLELSS